MSPTFDPVQFWNDRLAADPSLRGTGHRAFSFAYNQLLYTAQAEALTDLLDNWRVDLNGKSVLDVGCGVGFYVDFFVSRGAQDITGFDIAQSSIRYLQRCYPQYEFHLIDIGSAQVPLARQFDLVSAVSVLYHLVDDEHFECGLRNLARLTKIGGYLVVSDQFASGRFAPRHVRFRSLAIYSRVLREAGLEILDVSPIYYLMNRVVIPKIGPLILSRPVVAQALFNLDQRWRRAGRSNGAGMKFLLAKRSGL